MTFLITIQDTSSWSYNHHTKFYGNIYGSPTRLYHGLMVTTLHPSKVSHCNAASKSLYETGSFQNATFRNGTRLVCSSPILHSPHTVAVSATGGTTMGLGTSVVPILVYLALLVVIYGILHDFLLLDEVAGRTLTNRPSFRMGLFLGTKFDQLVEELQSLWTKLRPQCPSTLCTFATWIPTFVLWLLYTALLALFFCLYAFVLSLFSVVLMFWAPETFYTRENVFRVQSLLLIIQLAFLFATYMFVMGFYPYYYISLDDEVQVDGCEHVICSYSVESFLANLVYCLAVFSQFWAFISRTLTEITTSTAGFVNFFTVPRSAPLHILVANNEREPLMYADSILRTVPPPTFVDPELNLKRVFLGFSSIGFGAVILMISLTYMLKHLVQPIYVFFVIFFVAFGYLRAFYVWGRQLGEIASQMQARNHSFFEQHEEDVKVIDVGAKTDSYHLMMDSVR